MEQTSALAKSLHDLDFLVGRWSGKAEGSATGGGTLTSSSMFTHDPGKDVISGYRENMDGKKLENRILMIFIHDRNTDKLVRKDIYSYGFIVNQVGEEREGRFVFDSVSMDGEPDYFKGIRFRTFIEKHSKERMTMSVEVAEKGREFHLYVQQKFRRVQ